MVIRQDQVEALSEYAARSFEDRMVAHVRGNFPETYRVLGERRAREVIEEGMLTAKVYHLSSERDVCWFIDMIFLFGRRFDQDPGLPWAAEILNDASIVDSAYKTELLRSAAEEHEAEARGILT